jgi:hypothetical protein
MIELLLTGCIDNCSISFSLKNNLVAFIKLDTVTITLMINKNNAMNALDALLNVSIFFNIVVNRNTSIPTKQPMKITENNKEIILFNKDLSLPNINLKSLARRVNIINLHMCQKRF